MTDRLHSIVYVYYHLTTINSVFVRKAVLLQDVFSGCEDRVQLVCVNYSLLQLLLVITAKKSDIIAIFQGSLGKWFNFLAKTIKSDYPHSTWHLHLNLEVKLLDM